MDATNAANIIAPYTAGKENFSAYPYFDVNGYAIGYGNHYYEDGSAVSADDDAISKEDAYNLMLFYLEQNAAAIISALTTDIQDYQVAALADLRYRVGDVSQVVANINAGADESSVASEIKLYNKVNGLFNAVAQARANDEAAMYMGDNVGGVDPVVIGLGVGVLALTIFFFATR